MTRKPSIASSPNPDLAEEMFRLERRAQKILKRMRGHWVVVRKTIRVFGKLVDRTDDRISGRIENEKRPIGKTMLSDSYFTGPLDRIGAALLFQFGIERGKKRFGKFG